MIIFLISGYAWNKEILLPLHMAERMHTNLDLYLVFFFLAHVLISTKFTLARWRIGDERLVNLLLIAIGVLFFWFVLAIDQSG
ncbi:MAG TPA: hypothetical protein PLY52_07080 [Methanothrix sp.]|jgi:hypothetical protein|uniref:hypothetical protein n=2 Tax=Methanothrix sp. TaxID=90426 RepID=UPI002C1A2E7F|nr:hypothetical protein [Methanothrix sp.]MDI9416609.1 hypothetical protein [Euryarchaeota archaeon]HON36051.1 hypothetical protein [Methanothrix sp.]HRU75498.1 hypothetical protein [Methanothrix sp.]